MLTHMKLGLCAFIVFIVIPQGLSIKCWTCRSDLDPKCADPIDNSTLPITDCNQQIGLSGLRPSLCRKIRQKVDGQWNYIRDCAYPGDDGNQGNDRFYTTCNDRDGCNSSSAFAPLPLLLVCFVALSFLLFKA